MKKLALSASMLGALALAACGGGDDGGIIVPDGGGGDGGNVGICNPQTQAGCNPGEKCTAIFPPAGTMGPIVTGCVPDGTVEDGGACNRPLADMGGVDTGRGDGTRTDDCVGGTFCDSQNGMDICTPLCGIGVAGTCTDNAAGTARACVGISGLFDDLPMGNETGVCVPQCQPVSDGVPGLDNDTCPEAEGCFGLFTTNEFVCLRIPEEAAGLVAYDTCAPNPPGDPNACFLNSAPKGAVIITAQDYGAAGQGIVTPWCKPINTHTESADPANDANGDEAVLACGAANLASGAQGGQCRFIQSMFSDTTEVPIDIGICVPTVLGPAWLDATMFDLQAFLDDETGMVPLCPGCVDLATFMGGAAAPGRKTWEDIRKTLPKAPPELKAALKDYMKDRNAPAPVIKKALEY